MNQEDVVSKYGPIKDGVWKDELKWCSLFSVPDPICKSWIKSLTHAPTAHIYCNRDLHVPLKGALENVIERGLVGELKSFDGCYDVRNRRGEDQYSAHSWSMAIDINARDNPLGTNGSISKELVKCFTDVGWNWGGEFARKDPMHFSLLGF